MGDIGGLEGMTSRIDHGVAVRVIFTHWKKRSRYTLDRRLCTLMSRLDALAKIKFYAPVEARSFSLFVAFAVLYSYIVSVCLGLVLSTDSKFVKTSTESLFFNWRAP